MAKMQTRTRQTFIQRSRSKGPEEKAIYHAVIGAGKRRVVRDFFDLSAADADVIADRLQQSLDRRVTHSA